MADSLEEGKEEREKKWGPLSEILSQIVYEMMMMIDDDDPFCRLKADEENQKTYLQLVTKNSSSM